MVAEAPAERLGVPFYAPPLADRDFRLIRELIEQVAGIHLSDCKRALLAGRLNNRLRSLGLQTFGEYYARVSEDEAERVRMLDCISTNETHFFREPEHFKLLENTLFPQLERQAELGAIPKRVRVWSAGCSTGEEPYSLAMVLLTKFPASRGWTVEVHATDLSTRVLDAARNGVWPIQRASEIPEPYLKRFMLRGTGSQTGKMRAGDEVRTVLRFERLNLNDETYRVAGPFDFVFCRNVLIYFAQAAKPRIVGQLTRCLSPSGCLFLGHSETLAGITNTMRPVIPTVYAHATPAPQSR
jgi:chemotaxis protein methyltransferase CheR